MTITIQVRQDHPQGALEDCGDVLSLIYDLIGGGGDVELSERGGCGLMELLRGVTDTLDVVHLKVNALLADREPVPMAAPVAPKLTEPKARTRAAKAA